MTTMGYCHASHVRMRITQLTGPDFSPAWSCDQCKVLSSDFMKCAERSYLFPLSSFDSPCSARQSCTASSRPIPSSILLLILFLSWVFVLGPSGLWTIDCSFNGCVQRVFNKTPESYSKDNVILPILERPGGCSGVRHGGELAGKYLESCSVPMGPC